ncbi:hypothetical protein MSG28_005201 [Choristoneura fumiferana]|uniref:Uncharacterized protein n=1 Tax=Choristoneura fumiferana TaxID=7141 RepID=A0ACC0JQG8_CHOFU|nr:hypothetical protein MSG28_005201 [Choristoneura fumiferana]
MGKETDRKGKGKERTGGSEPADPLATFTLPDSLPCSEIDFPALITKKPKANWKEVLQESEQNFKEIEEYVQSKNEPVLKSPFMKTECDYIRDEVFIFLLPALEEALNKAKIWEALARQKCFFNGIDWIVQVLWNNNPRYPERACTRLHLFNMPWVREYLAKK